MCIRDSPFVASLSHWSIDHASLSRWCTVPTPNRHLQHLGARYVFCPCYTDQKKLLTTTLSPSSCFAVCGHHLPPRTANVLLPLIACSLQKSSTSHSSICLISSNTSRSSFHISLSHDVNSTLLNVTVGGGRIFMSCTAIAIYHRPFDHTPRHPYNAGKKRVGCSQGGRVQKRPSLLIQRDGGGLAVI